jgi:hypothetical protein
VTHVNDLASPMHLATRDQIAGLTPSRGVGDSRLASHRVQVECSRGECPSERHQTIIPPGARKTISDRGSQRSH